MTEFIASFIVIGLRLCAPFALFRFPLAGMFLSIAADASDVMIFEVTGYGLFAGRYHFFDKWLDVYYLTFAYTVSRKWEDLRSRRIAGVLFFWRLLGAILFELTGLRYLLLLAPNIFENFYILRLVIQRLKPSFRFSQKNLFVILILAGIPKIVQEYIMHFRYPDQTWFFLRDTIFWWLYS